MQVELEPRQDYDSKAARGKKNHENVKQSNVFLEEISETLQKTLH